MTLISKTNVVGTVPVSIVHLLKINDESKSQG